MSFWNILKNANIIGRIGALEKSNAVQTATTRPYGELTVFEAKQKLPVPYYHQLRYLAKRNTSLRTIIHVIQDKVLERDPEFIPRFVSICMECGKEYQNETKICGCGGMTRAPDQAQLEHIKEFFKDCNDNDQSFKAVLHECEDNLNILDDAFLLILKEYHFDANNNLKYARVREILSADPEWFRFDLDDKLRHGVKHWTCVEHRTIHDAPGVCKECGKPLFPVWYIYDEGSAPMPYLKDEIIHWSCYSPSKTFGYPPVATVFEEAMIELNGNVLLNDTYREQRPPKGILAIVTKNLPSLQKFWQKEMEQVRINPNHMPVMGIESDSGRGSATYTALLNSVADMDVLNVSERMRDGISGLYRITPLYHGGTEGIGGLNAEDVQRAVTAEPISSAQQGYHEEVFPKLLAMFGITDWTLEFPSPYPANDNAELDKRTKETQIATMMHSMGFQVSLDEETGDLLYSGESQAPQPDMDGFGGDGGGDAGSDGGDNGGYQDELLLGKELQKARKYISDPSKAPKGAKVQRGKMGGYFYDAAPVRTSLKVQPEEIKATVKDLYAKGYDANMVVSELKEKHGIKVHPETVNRFLEHEGVGVRPKRETVSRKDVETQQKTITEQAKQIDDLSGKMDALQNENAATKAKISAMAQTSQKQETKAKYLERMMRNYAPDDVVKRMDSDLADMEQGKSPETNPEAESGIPKMENIDFPSIAGDVYNNIQRRGKDDIKTMDDGDIRSYIEDFTPAEYNYESGTGKLRDEFIERTLKEFKDKYQSKNRGKP